jgi:uncharacterized membrane protein YfcA
MQAIGLVSGLLGGFLGGLAGLGGGIVMIPLMTWLAKATQHQAHGTSLVAIVFTALTGAATYFLHGDLSWSAALVLAVSATATARFGARYAHALPEKKLKRAFGIFLICVSLMLVGKGFMGRGGYEFTPWAFVTLFLAIGTITGFVSGMMGVGGGGIMVPLMVLAGGMQQHMAQGTALLAMIPASFTGALTHYRLGNVRLDIAVGLSAGALIGGYIGATAAGGLPDLYLRLAFASIGIFMGIRYVNK